MTKEYDSKIVSVIVEQMVKKLNKLKTKHGNFMTLEQDKAIERMLKEADSFLSVFGVVP